MAALTITDARPTPNTIIANRVIGATVARGDAVYKMTSDQRHYLADNNAATAEPAAAVGVMLGTGVSGGSGVIGTSGNVWLGTTMTVGETYCVGATPGTIVPIGDITTGMRKTILGTASTANILNLDIRVTGIVVA